MQLLKYHEKPANLPPWGVFSTQCCVNSNNLVVAPSCNIHSITASRAPRLAYLCNPLPDNLQQIPCLVLPDELDAYPAFQHLQQILKLMRDLRYPKRLCLVFQLSGACIRCVHSLHSRSFSSDDLFEHGYEVGLCAVFVKAVGDEMTFRKSHRVRAWSTEVIRCVLFGWRIVLRWFRLSLKSGKWCLPSNDLKDCGALDCTSNLNYINKIMHSLGMPSLSISVNIVLQSA